MKISCKANYIKCCNVVEIETEMKWIFIWKLIVAITNKLVLNMQWKLIAKQFNLNVAMQLRLKLKVEIHCFNLK